MLKNGYLRLAPTVTPAAETIFPAIFGAVDKTGVLTSPVLKGGCGVLTVVMAGAKLESVVPKGLK